MSVACVRVPGSALGARGVEILGSILAFQSNGLFIGQTNRVRESEGGGQSVHCLWPVVVSIEECTSGCVMRMVCKGCSHSVYVLVAVIRLCGHSHRHARFWGSC